MTGLALLWMLLAWWAGEARAAPVDISPTTQNATAPHLAVDAAGDAVVVWQVSDPVTRNHTVWAAVSPADGSFGAPVNLSAAGEDATAPQVAIDPAGDAIVVWDRFVATGDFVVRAAWRPSGGTFGQASDVSGASGQTTSPQVGIDAAGDAVALWSLYDGTSHVIQAAARTAATGTWQPLGAVSAPGEDTVTPHLAVDQAGDALAVWERFTGGPDIARAAWRTAGGGFASPVDVSPPGEDAAEPQVAIDGGGEAVVVWAGGNASAMAEARSSSPGGPFSAGVNLSAPGVNRPLAVAVGPGGAAVAAWAQNNGGELQAVTRPAGAGFGSPVNLAASGTNPQAAVDADGAVSVVWEQQSGAIRAVVGAGAPASGGFASPVALSVPGQDASDPQTSFDLVRRPYYVWLRLDATTGNEVVQALLPPPPQGGPAPPPPVGCSPCRLSVLRVSPHTFSTTGRRVAGRCVAVTGANARRPHCTRAIALRISFDLPESAAVGIAIKRQLAGRLVVHRCAAVRTPRARPGRHCTRWVRLPGTINRQGRAGSNSLVFTGRIGGRRLHAGSYQLLATPTFDGQPAPPVTTRFRIVGGR